MKIYDCFTFYNEFELLELRLKSLNDYVDLFVLVEADRTQSNQPKPFYFEENKDRFEEFLPKIRNVKINVNLPHLSSGDWFIENAQRNAITAGLSDAEPDDLIFISDLDEFPNPVAIQEIIENKSEVFAYYNFSFLQENNKARCPVKLLTSIHNILEISPITFQQSMHYYYFDYIQLDDLWYGTIVTRYKNLSSPQNLRNLHKEFPYISNSGWHFSYMGGVEKIINKLNSIVEGEYYVQLNSNLNNPSYLKDCMKKGKDIFGRFHGQVFTEYDTEKINLPYIRRFLKKYPQFLKATDPGLI